MGRVAATSRMLAMCAVPIGAFLGGWLATTYDIRTLLYAAAPAAGPDPPASKAPAEESAPDVL